ncbi:MAG: hypothetical protein KBD24_02735 [Candidatus Pacebacteria bacterium]|nr:hypothetical protein [Candidatus Paceibacterota bacterium]
MENNESEKVESLSITSEPFVASPSRNLQISIILGSVIIGVAIIGATYLYTESLKVKEPSDLTQVEEDAVWRPEEGFPDDTATTVDDIYENGARVSDGSRFSELLDNTKIEKYELDIDWLPRPVNISLESVPVNFDDYYSRLYETGTIKNGVLIGKKVYLLYASELGEWASLYTFDSQMAIRIEDWLPVDEQSLVIEDQATKLRLIRDERSLGAALLDLEEIASDNGTSIKRLALNSGSKIPDGELYQYQQCFFARTPSDLLFEYTVDVPFIQDDVEGGYGTANISFTRIDGIRMSSEYEIYDRISYGCGSLCSPLKVLERSDSDFVNTGVTDDGHNLFVLKNSHDPILTELYNQPNTRAFVNTTEGGYEPLESNKYSYEQFLSMAPILFWKDQLGRWVHFVHSEFLVLAEKCKPVIYLYPEEETDLHVEVKPNVGFTKTIPEYKDGWNVTAYPDGTIFDKESKEKYDYLYWTGWVEGYPLIEQGWVVAQKDLPAFFDTYLPKYGLVGKEIEDFKEYWEGDMDDAPYYAVSFVDKAVIDTLSPLSLDVTPDIVIRVLMTAMPLERPITLNAPRIPETPVRHGFTVAEWGGTILRTE